MGYKPGFGVDLCGVEGHKRSLRFGSSGGGRLRHRKQWTRNERGRPWLFRCLEFSVQPGQAPGCARRRSQNLASAAKNSCPREILCTIATGIRLNSRFILLTSCTVIRHTNCSQTRVSGELIHYFRLFRLPRVTHLMINSLQAPGNCVVRCDHFIEPNNNQWGRCSCLLYLLLELAVTELGVRVRLSYDK